MISRLPLWILIGSVMLALNAGFINSVALLSFANNAVSHVTGTATIAADAFAQKQWSVVFSTFTIVLSFIVGAIISGLLVGDEALRLGRRYGVALLCEASLLLGAWYGFKEQAFYAEWLASAACGLQNALVATYSGSVIRTTHMTGIVSDIGSAIGNFFAGRGLKRVQLTLQICIFFAFLVGATLGSLAFAWVGYNALLTNAAFIFLVALSYIALLYRRGLTMSKED